MSPFEVLVGCEFSGTVRDAFACDGHRSVSCDILPATGNHIQADIVEVLPRGGNLAVLHPPCTAMTVSGNRWYAGTEERERELLSGPSVYGKSRSIISTTSRSKTLSAFFRSVGASPIRLFSLGSLGTRKARPRACGSITCRSFGLLRFFRSRPADTGAIKRRAARTSLARVLIAAFCGLSLTGASLKPWSINGGICCE